MEILDLVAIKLPLFYSGSLLKHIGQRSVYSFLDVGLPSPKIKGEPRGLNFFLDKKPVDLL